MKKLKSYFKVPFFSWTRFSTTILVISFYFNLIEYAGDTVKTNPYHTKVNELKALGFEAWIANSMLLAFFSIILYFMFWIVENVYNYFRKSMKFEFDNTEVIVKFGDLFQEEGVKVIPFNEYYDTLKDIVKEGTVNYQFLNRLNWQTTDLDDKLGQMLANNGTEIASDEKNIGKQMKYDLATVFPYQHEGCDYLLTAFSHCDSKFHHQLDSQEYLMFWTKFWDEGLHHYIGKTIVVPLIGAGITHISNGKKNQQELLEIILMSFKFCNNFEGDTKLVIVLHPSVRDKISFQKLAHLR